MAVLIGAATTISTSLFPQGGITNVNFSLKANITRLWQLGSWSPYDTYNIQQRELSISAYGKKPSGQGGSQVFSLTPTTSCTDASSVSVTINPGACGIVISPFTDSFYPSSYSYSKDNFGWGTESWSFTSKPIISGYTGTTYFLRGISTGQMLVGTGMMTAADIGIVIDDAASRDSNGNYIDGESGSVQAGSLSIGEYAVQREIVVSSIGGSQGKSDGYKGSGNVSIQHQQIFI